MDKKLASQLTMPDVVTYNSGHVSKDGKHEISVYVGNKPAFQCLKYLGLLPMIEDINGRLTFRWASLSTLCSIVMVCAWFVVGVYHGRNIYHFDKKTLSANEEILMNLIMLTMGIPYLGIPMLFDTKSIAVFLEKFREYQGYHEKTTGREFKIDHTKRLKVIICASIIKTLILSALATYAVDKITKPHGIIFQSPWTFFMVSVYLLSILDAIVGTYLSILLGIREIAEDFRANLMESDLSPETLLKYSIQWRELSMLTNQMTSTFSATLVPYMIIGYAICLYCWSLRALKIGNIYFSTILCAITSFLIFIVPDFTQRTTVKVGSLMAMDFIYMRRKGVRADQSDALARFEEVTVHYPPQIKFLGCINFDRNLILGVFSQFVQAMAVIREIKAEDKARGMMRAALTTAAASLETCERLS